MSLRNDLEAKYQVVLNPQLHLTEKVRDPSQPYYTLQNNLVDQHITEFTPDQLKQHTAELFSENVLYKEIKEKLVGQELYFHPTLKNILPHIIAESSLDEEVKEVLTQSLDKIVYATVESIMPWWQIALYAIDVVFALLMVGSLFMMFRAKRRSEEKA